MTAVSVAQVPGVWVVCSIALAVFGRLPRLTPGVWGLCLGFVAIGELGVLWHAPQGLIDLSPFQHAPRLPLDPGTVTALVGLTATAAVVAALGCVGRRRRDLTAA